MFEAQILLRYKVLGPQDFFFFDDDDDSYCLCILQTRVDILQTEIPKIRTLIMIVIYLNDPICVYSIILLSYILYLKTQQ